MVHGCHGMCVCVLVVGPDVEITSPCKSTFHVHSVMCLRLA